MVTAWALTGLFLYAVAAWASGHIPELLIGVLSAWTGELLFFTVVGVVVSVITLKDPTQEDFDQRLRILYGKADIPDSVMAYNKLTIARLSGYAKLAKREVYIDEYNDRIQAYRARFRTEYHYLNLLPDVLHDDTLPLQVVPDIFEGNSPTEIGRIVSLNIDGEETIKAPHIIPKDGFFTSIRLRMPPRGESHLVFQYWMWLRIGASQTMHPKRILEQITMEVINQSDHTPQLEIDGDPRGVIALLFNQPCTFNPVQGVSPGERIFTFKMLAPTEQAGPEEKSDRM